MIKKGNQLTDNYLGQGYTLLHTLNTRLSLINLLPLKSIGKGEIRIDSCEEKKEKKRPQHLTLQCERSTR